MKKAFTLIELLIVIAIIGILSSVILVSLNSGRDKAKWANYISYVSQVSRLVEATHSAGEFDSISGTQAGCLGIYPGNSCWGGYTSWEKTSVALNNSLEEIGTIPDGQTYFKNPAYGTVMQVDPNYVWIFAFVGADTDQCDNFGWRNIHLVSGYCYTRISR